MRPIFWRLRKNHLYFCLARVVWKNHTFLGTLLKKFIINSKIDKNCYYKINILELYNKQLADPPDFARVGANFLAVVGLMDFHYIYYFGCTIMIPLLLKCRLCIIVETKYVLEPFPHLWPSVCKYFLLPPHTAYRLSQHSGK